MPDVFISYSTQDAQIAQFIHRHLNSENLSVFLAPISLVPGQIWKEEILRNLRGSSWVLFLASNAACKSDMVKLEIGIALGTGKRIVPIVWDMDPACLPNWLDGFQALDLRKLSPEQVNAQVSGIAKQIKASVSQGQLIAGIIIAAILYILFKK